MLIFQNVPLGHASISFLSFLSTQSSSELVLVRAPNFVPIRPNDPFELKIDYDSANLEFNIILNGEEIELYAPPNLGLAELEFTLLQVDGAGITHFAGFARDGEAKLLFVVKYLQYRFSQLSTYEYKA